MAKIPGQRKPGSFGGDGHRSNRGAFRASGGSVPPKKSCLVLALAMASVPAVLLVAAGYTVVEVLS